jgi:hypothetical protein
LTAEIASITANIDTLMADLKEKKSALKKTEKEVDSLEAKKAEAEAVLKKLLANGMCELPKELTLVMKSGLFT